MRVAKDFSGLEIAGDRCVLHPCMEQQYVEASVACLGLIFMLLVCNSRSTVEWPPLYAEALHSIML